MAIFGVGAFALSKMFGGGDGGKDDGKGFFEKLTRWVPGGNFTVVGAILLGGLYYLFKEDIDKWK